MESQNTVRTTKKKVKKIITVAQAEEQHLLSVAKNSTSTSSSTTTKETIQTKTIINMANLEDQQTIKATAKKEKVKAAKTNGTTKPAQEEQEEKVGIKQNGDHLQIEGDEEVVKKNGSSKKKTKSKKSEKGDTDKKNISVKSSFRKFDALQKRSLIHVRSIDASTAQEKFSNPQEAQKNCRLCDKEVYKMEEIKAEKSIYHKNCFRCNECNKQLKVDNYQSHEGVLYCLLHFKLLLAPKSVEETETVQPRKPELIIRENQPVELPPDVVRASDKPDLGLEELQQLNVRSRFQVFEQGNVNNSDDQQMDVQRNNNNNVVRRSASIMSKVAKLQQLGSTANSQYESSASSGNEDNDDDKEDIDFDDDNPNAVFIRQKKREQQREMPVGLGEAMHDIRTLFEKGHGIKREERREERKQEIQNIRSRLFMGKQARIKEMYQQAVADSEHATDKKSNIDIEVDSKSLRDRFENGKIFRDNQSGNENESENLRKPAIEKEADVFESAISKKSRSIFMELDMVTGKNQNILPHQSNNNRSLQHQKSLGSISNQSKTELDGDVVKCGEAIEDVKIETSEISEKFKFFEKYHPTENKKRAFRITPPRDGVVKMPSPEENGDEGKKTKELSPDRNIIAHSRTTSMMLNKFRELEKNPNTNSDNSPRPLKCFTPPPDGNRRLYNEQESDEYDSSEDDEDDEDESNLEDDDDDYDDYNKHAHLPKDDEALKEAQNAARAKQLRLKFEKWQANEIKREKNDDPNQIINNVSDENIESTQSIRERFEKMRNNEKSPQPTRPRYQVNRFV